MKYKRIFAGSCETDYELKTFLDHASTIDAGVPRSLFKADYFWKIMTVGRNGDNDSYPGSQALDDTGGFFEERDGLVYLTDKAKKCVHV